MLNARQKCKSNRDHLDMTSEYEDPPDFVDYSDAPLDRKEKALKNWLKDSEE